MTLSLVKILKEIKVKTKPNLDYENASFLEAEYIGPDRDIIHPGMYVDILVISDYATWVPSGGHDYIVRLIPKNNFKAAYWQSGYTQFDSNAVKKYIEYIKEKIDQGKYEIYE